jgi:CDP-diacylglycerol---glycerol-3-phosphate 3-phosphatidyltransferase
MANTITLSRFPLLFLYLVLTYTGSATAIFLCVPFITVIMLMDMIDGIVARRLGEVSLLGSTLDIAVDRAFEIILWVVYAHMGLIPVIIPIIAITRGTMTDAVRCVGLSNGRAAFEQVHHPLSRFLVSSRLMRDLYGAIKGAAFALLTFDLGIHRLGDENWLWVHTVALIFAWGAIGLTILRGLPVIVEKIAMTKAMPMVGKRGA